MDSHKSIVSDPVAYALTCFGGFLLLFSIFSRLIRERLFISESCLAFLYGVIIGPHGMNIINLREWGGRSGDITDIITLHFTRVVLTLCVFTVGLEFPKEYMFHHWKSLFFLLVPVMTWGWLVSAGLIYGLIPGLNFISSLAVGACLSPTDPALTMTLVIGGKWAEEKKVPSYIRQLLTAESGYNSVTAYLCLGISLFLLLDSRNVGHAENNWFFLVWPYQIILSIVIGAIMGFMFRFVMKSCRTRSLTAQHFYVVLLVAMLFTVGITFLRASKEQLIPLLCGTALSWDGIFDHQTEEFKFSSNINLLFNIGSFIYIGAWMPFEAFNNKETTLTVSRLIVIAILIFIFRRLPVIIAHRWIPDIRTPREAFFSSHFGPIGVGAVFLSTLVNWIIVNNERFDSPQAQLLAEAIQPIVAFMVLSSIIFHGVSVPRFSIPFLIRSRRL